MDPDKTYQPFDSEASEYELAPPTNDRVKRLMRLELRAPGGGTTEQRTAQAEVLGLDPGSTVPMDENDIEVLSLFDYLSRATSVVLDIDTDGKTGDLRIDVAQEAIADFTASVSLTSGDTEIS